LGDERRSTVVARARAWAETRAAARAYTFLKDGETESASLTFAELDVVARAIAAALQDHAGTSERALLLYPPGLDFIAAFLGCLYAGIVAVPAHPPRANRSTAGIRAVASDAGARVVLSTSGFLDTQGKHLRQLPDLAHLEWIATDALDVRDAERWRENAIDPQALAFLQYTSGSTSTPKGVMVTHANLFHNERMVEHGFGHDENTRFVSWLPVYHDMGLVGMILQPLYLGIPCVLLPPAAFLQRPVRWLKAMSRYRATTSGAPNFAYDLCVDKIRPEERAGLDLSSWTLAFNGAEPVRAETLDRFTATYAPFGFRPDAFYPCFGLAESTLIAAGADRRRAPVVVTVDRDAIERQSVRPATDSARALRVSSCGRALLDQRIVVVNPRTMTVETPSQVGEIWISGPSVTAGYFNKPELTERTFRAFLSDGRGPFLRTGDLGFISDGELFVTGRLKDLIILRGRNYYPHDIELTIERRCPGITSGGTAAFSIDRGGEERLVVAAEIDRECRTAAQADAREIAATLRRAVGEDHEIELDTVALLKPGALPKTTSGKVRRLACRQAFLAGTLETVVVIGPAIEEAPPAPSVSTANRWSRASMEAWLVAEVARHVSMDGSQIDVRAPFAQYGLSSLMAVSITNDLGVWLGVELEATVFWDYPTIEALVGYLTTSAASSGKG
jgi:acyl-CoA synthetase (AMP-forming)/AMP-acid ligase II/acyl carrier protein